MYIYVVYTTEGLGVVGGNVDYSKVRCRFFCWFMVTAHPPRFAAASSMSEISTSKCCPKNFFLFFQINGNTRKKNVTTRKLFLKKKTETIIIDDNEYVITTAKISLARATLVSLRFFYNNNYDDNAINIGRVSCGVCYGRWRYAAYTDCRSAATGAAHAPR